jgi:hypothetical protein
MNDLQVKNVQVDYELPKLAYDLEPLKEQVNAIKEQYSNWVVVEDDLKAAKDIVAKLNKAAKEISDNRIVVVREIKEPITKFENEIKLMTADLKQLSESIKNQLDTYEEKRKELKKQEILALPEFDSEYMLFDEKWLNKTYDIKDIKYDLQCQEMSFSKNKSILLSVIGDTIEVSKYVNELKKTLDLEMVLQLYKNDMQVREKTLSEMGVNAVESNEVKSQATFNASGIKYMRSLKINATKEQIALLKEFLTKYEIEYEVE